MIKYKAKNYYNPSIEKIEVEKETEKSIWINGNRSAKRSEYSCYFDTFKEAKYYLLEVAERKLRSARLNLERMQGFMGNIKGLKE